MKKTPNLFERDWTGNSSRVTDVPNPECDWVFCGEGVATRKLDGTCCLIENGVLWKRHEVKPGKSAPYGFRPADGPDDKTGKIMGWLPVGTGPEDARHREAFAALSDPIIDGTYELLGPKVNGNPEGHVLHILAGHKSIHTEYDQPPDRSYAGLKEWLSGRDIEGLVFHHPDGRMAKLKIKDFGLERKSATQQPDTAEGGG